LIKANQALSSFHLEAVPPEGLKELRNQLKQLANKANFPLSTLHRRLQDT